jgi:hypothetical protein
MKFVTYSNSGKEQLAFLINDNLYDTNLANPVLPSTMQQLLDGYERFEEIARRTEEDLVSGSNSLVSYASFSSASILAPLPRPVSCRDGYAFRQHVAAARRNRKVEMIPEFDQYPIFYFTNHLAVQGPGPIHCMPDHFQKLDFELETAVVLGRKGRNVRAADAAAGVVLSADERDGDDFLSALRELQRQIIAAELLVRHCSRPKRRLLQHAQGPLQQTASSSMHPQQQPPVCSMRAAPAKACMHAAAAAAAGACSLQHPSPQQAPAFASRACSLL